MDNLNFIQDIRKHICSGIKDGYTSLLLISVRKAIDEKTASPEQQVQLVSLQKELEDLHPQSNKTFLGASATNGFSKIRY